MDQGTVAAIFWWFGTLLLTIGTYALFGWPGACIAFALSVLLFTVIKVMQL